MTRCSAMTGSVSPLGRLKVKVMIVRLLIAMLMGEGPPSMTFEDLRVFVTVAAERSFSRAARKLRRTQPAVSQAIRRLEDDAGERLIDRSSRDGTLTDAGELLLDYA